jgi:hypothetical protein
MTSRSGPGLLVRSVLTLLPLGVLGILVLLPTLPAALRPVLAQLPDAPPVSLIVTAQAVQLLVFTAVGVLAGAWAAPHAGFCSRLVDRDWAGLRRDAAAAVLPGLAVGVVIGSADLLLAPLLGPGWARGAEAAQPWTPMTMVAGMAYGGLTEELMLRWGLVSLLTVLVWKVLARRAPRPSARVVVGVVVVAAVVLGVLHLGAVALVSPLTPLVVARTVVLNAVGGVVYGMLFVRRSLEAGMVAHAATHLALAGVVLVAGSTAGL